MDGIDVFSFIGIWMPYSMWTNAFHYFAVASPVLGKTAHMMICPIMKSARLTSTKFVRVYPYKVYLAVLELKFFHYLLLNGEASRTRTD